MIGAAVEWLAGWWPLVVAAVGGIVVLGELATARRFPPDSGGGE